MGLSIHYSGKIKDVKLVPELVEELKDICTTMSWNYHLFDNEKVNGIYFSPPECEPLFFTFSKDGVLCSPLLLHTESYRDHIHPATIISVKTQFAGTPYPEDYLDRVDCADYFQTAYRVYSFYWNTQRVR